MIQGDNNKAKNNNGFTLSEMLMTTLIICLVVVVLGGGTFVIKNAYDKVTAKAEAQTILSTAVTKIVDEFRYADSSSVTTDGEVTKFFSNSSGCVLWFENGSASVSKETNDGILKCRANTGVGDGIDKIQLLTDETMAEGLVPKITYSYDTAKIMFNATIKISYGEQDDFVKQTITIQPINID